MFLFYPSFMEFRLEEDRELSGLLIAVSLAPRAIPGRVGTQ